MRRMIFDQMHHVLGPRGVAGLPGPVLRGLYRASLHPDFGFWHARGLVARGRIAQATGLYGGAQDPLFAAHLRAEDGAGPVQAQIGYGGLRIAARIPARSPVLMTLVAGDVVLRQEEVVPKGGRAAFRIILPRAVLASFPRDTCLRLEVGARPLRPAWRVEMPHGDGTLAAKIAARGPLEKKGGFRPDPAEIRARQNGYLALYTRARAVFETALDRPLLILYGTLLGQVRGGDFIPGDDDFDVGFPCLETNPEAVRHDTIAVMERLLAAGFVVETTPEGRPFRLRLPGGDPSCHLDARPVFSPASSPVSRSGPGPVWLHKHASLPLPLSAFTEPDTGDMCGTQVLCPAPAEAFLAAYYGPGWATPDPGYSNSGRALPLAARRALRRLCLRRSEERTLAARYPGAFLPGRGGPLYPLGARAR